MTGNRRQFLKNILAGLGVTAAGAWAGCAEKRRPNILLIMADDMGFSDTGCYGGEIETPNIDRLAAEGMRFTQFYNNAICVPTRASLLTGLYPQQVGVLGNTPRIYKNAVTLAEVLKPAGYRTLMTGKWHAEQIPWQRGFDSHFGLADGCCNFFNPGPQRPGEPQPARKPYPRPYPHWRRWAIDDQEYLPWKGSGKGFYTTDAFTDYAIQYLEEYKGEDKPFFLYVAYTAPHYPLHARPEDIAKYRGTYMAGWDKIRRTRYQKMLEMGLVDKNWPHPPRGEGIPAWDDVDNKAEWDLKMAVYAAMIDRMDQNIGRILTKLEHLGELDNTLIMFLSDNGGCDQTVHVTPDVPPGPVDSYRTVDAPWANASNTPFRKYKAWDHEGGTCTPFIARWPGVIEPGSMTRQVGHIMDIMATVVDICGAPYPRHHQQETVFPMEGKSLVPVFRGEQRRGHDALFWRVSSRRGRAVRQGRWKLVAADRKQQWELYDMETDRMETNDLADRFPDKVKELAEMYKNWEIRVGINNQEENP